MDLTAQLRQEEGAVPHAYQDHLGYWTIGVGRLIDRRKGGGLSPEEIDYLLANDIERKTRQVYGAPTGTATRATFDTATVTTAQLAERVKALIDDLRANGLMGG